jgi:hypothetical protein
VQDDLDGNRRTLLRMRHGYSPGGSLTILLMAPQRLTMA